MQALTIGILALSTALTIQSGCTGGDEESGSVQSALDEDLGIQCSTNSSGGNFTSYYFKSGLFRTESSFAVPGVTAYDIQPNADDYYKVTIDSSNCGAIRLDPTLSYEQWKQMVVGAYEAQKGTPGANQPGAAQCVEMNLADDLFALPAGCPLSN